jgi:hypothetical protein
MRESHERRATSRNPIERKDPKAQCLPTLRARIERECAQTLLRPVSPPVDRLLHPAAQGKPGDAESLLRPSDSVAQGESVEASLRSGD